MQKQQSTALNNNTNKSYKPRFNPFSPPIFNQKLTPDTDQFKNIPFNIAVFTKYGRSIWILHGNQQKCSSFFATLGTIVNKLQLSFGKNIKLQKQQESEISPAKLKSIKQFKTVNGKPQRFELLTLKIKNFMYVCWLNSATKISIHQLSILATIQFLHFQLTSCFTQKANEILEKTQTYDPSINFGNKGRAMQNLLYYAVKNGIQSIPILFDSVPILPLTSNTRAAIFNILKSHQEQAIQINILITLNHLVCIHKKKQIYVHVRDIFIFFNLIQSQSSLSKSQNWFPICLPGVEANQMVFCYLNFFNQNLVHIMIADDVNIFPTLSQFSKQIKQKLIQTGISDKINSVIQRSLISDPSLQRMNLTKHFIVKYKNQFPKQMIMSFGQYFGKQLQQNREQLSQQQFQIYLNIYGQLYQHFLQRKSNKKQSLHVQSFYLGQCNPTKNRKIRGNSNTSNIQLSANLLQNESNNMEGIRGTYIPKAGYICDCNLQKQFLGGYYSDGQQKFTMFMIASGIAQLQDAKSIFSSILKYVRQEQNSLFISKHS